jgi:hypothetical protein
MQPYDAMRTTFAVREFTDDPVPEALSQIRPISTSGASPGGTSAMDILRLNSASEVEEKLYLDLRRLAKTTAPLTQSWRRPSDTGLYHEDIA